uniref:Uncharacterized protein n=2 Tax=unclassified Caudoviricetes TaxID=2788787 RepID=A0A8S5QBU7_9CAUD|nr:MAG TPA: hypothetical protein [Siphoviridae sp. ctQWG7]DAE16751.1 MAG TPA: hypothetical protein [Siphoviridae sp. ct8Hy2]
MENQQVKRKTTEVRRRVHRYWQCDTGCYKGWIQRKDCRAHSRTELEKT